MHAEPRLRPYTVAPAAALVCVCVLLAPTLVAARSDEAATVAYTSRCRRGVDARDHQPLPACVDRLVLGTPTHPIAGGGVSARGTNHYYDVEVDPQREIVQCASLEFQTSALTVDTSTDAYVAPPGVVPASTDGVGWVSSGHLAGTTTVLVPAYHPVMQAAATALSSAWNYAVRCDEAWCGPTPAGFAAYNIHVNAVPNPTSLAAFAGTATPGSPVQSTLCVPDTCAELSVTLNVTAGTQPRLRVTTAPPAESHAAWLAQRGWDLPQGEASATLYLDRADSPALLYLSVVCDAADACTSADVRVDVAVAPVAPCRGSTVATAGATRLVPGEDAESFTTSTPSVAHYYFDLDDCDEATVALTVHSPDALRIIASPPGTPPASLSDASLAVSAATPIGGTAMLTLAARDGTAQPGRWHVAVLCESGSCVASPSAQWTVQLTRTALPSATEWTATVTSADLAPSVRSVCWPQPQLLQPQESLLATIDALDVQVSSGDAVSVVVSPHVIADATADFGWHLPRGRAVTLDQQGKLTEAEFRGYFGRSNVMHIAVACAQRYNCSSADFTASLQISGRVVGTPAEHTPWWQQAEVAVIGVASAAACVAGAVAGCVARHRVRQQQQHDKASGKSNDFATPQAVAVEDGARIRSPKSSMADEVMVEDGSQIRSPKSSVVDGDAAAAVAPAGVVAYPPSNDAVVVSRAAAKLRADTRAPAAVRAADADVTNTDVLSQAVARLEPQAAVLQAAAGRLAGASPRRRRSSSSGGRGRRDRDQQ